MTSGWCAGMDRIFLNRDGDEVIDDSVYHDCLTQFTAMLEIFPSQILNH